VPFQRVVVILLAFLVVPLGIAAAAIDVGSWYRADRALQSSVDAAALAAAQALPDDPGGAGALASEYAGQNGGGLETVSVTTAVLGNDTVVVTGKRSAPGFFSKVLGIDSVESSRPVDRRPAAGGRLTSPDGWVG
jgi:Flp pilus assembly protein TadG